MANTERDTPLYLNKERTMPSTQKLEARQAARAAADRAHALRRQADAMPSGPAADSLYAQAQALDRVCDQHCAVAASIRIECAELVPVGGAA
jgi:hypothetical protein